MLAQASVLLASILTAGVVAAVVGPPLFHEHLVRAGGARTPERLDHVERAYREASAVSLGIALVIALACAFAVTWYLTRRLQRPMSDLTTSARSMARGHYDERVSPRGAGPELESLAEAFNTMAGRLQVTEDTRRRLLADLAHEMRTPVSTITAYLEALDDGVTSWTPDTSSVLAEQTARLARLADDIDDVSRAEEGRIVLDRQAHRVGDLLHTAIATARDRFETKGVRLLVRPSPAAASVVWVDEQRFGQVLTNILDNALRHTPAGGRVSIATETADTDAVIRVSDDGEGITAEVLPHVFERFYRGDTARDRRDRGSGIGLTISRALVAAHGGSLSARSDGRGHGATFVIELPVAVDASANGPRFAAPPSG